MHYNKKVKQVTASQNYERMPRQTAKHKEKSSMEKAAGDQKWVRSSQDDVINATHSSKPLAHCLPHSDVSHMTGQLTDTGENHWLEGNERGIRQDLDLIQDRKNHIGPGLDRKMDKYKFT